MNVSEALRTAVKATLAGGATRYQVAKGSGVDHTNLSRFLFEGRDVRVSTVDRLSKFLGLELQQKTDERSPERLGPRHK